MGLQEVVTEVERGAERRAQEIVDEAQAKASEILASAADAAAAYETQRATQARRDADALKGQTLSNAEFEARKIVLETEAELRRELRATVLDGFAGFSGPLRESHLERLVRTASEVVPKGKVWGAKVDKKFLSGLPDHKWAGELDIAGGLIVEDPKGTVRLDLSYDTLLDGLWRDILRAEADLFQ